jgi:hypothetical protein
MEWIGRLWRGEVALGKAFWLFGVLVPIILAIAAGLFITAVLLVLVLFMFSPSGVPAWVTSGPNVVVVLAVIMFVYEVIAFVGVWRSAARFSGNRIYTIVARGVLGLCLVVIAATSGATIFAWMLTPTPKSMGVGH